MCNYSFLSLPRPRANLGSVWFLFISSLYSITLDHSATAPPTCYDLAWRYATWRVVTWLNLVWSDEVLIVLQSTIDSLWKLSAQSFVLRRVIQELTSEVTESKINSIGSMMINLCYEPIRTRFISRCRDHLTSASIKIRKYLRWVAWPSGQEIPGKTYKVNFYVR